MPPSTVFSYLRREHRRGAAPQISLPTSSSPATSAESPLTTPPQLPEIPGTPNIEDAFGFTPSYEAAPPPWGESPLDNDQSKLNMTFNTTGQLSSSASLAVPSPLAEKELRPHSSPEEYIPENTVMSQSNNSQLSVSGLRPDQGDGEPTSKPSSPFRLSFKGPRALQSEALEGQKRSPTAGPGASQFRLKTSPEELAGEKAMASHREARPDREVMENVHHKSGKAMLHLLNPMSLLARRRSSQITTRVEDTKLSTPSLVPAIPDDYDPRIRGKIVHDFSAPRQPRRNVSGNSGEGNTPGAQDLSPGHRWSEQGKAHSDHSPVFKEHFEDDKNLLQVENKGYLHSSLLTSPAPPGYEKSIPVFAKNLPSTLPEKVQNAINNDEDPYAHLPAELPGDTPVEVKTPAEDAVVPEKPPIPTATESDQDTIPIFPHPAASLPKHLKSNASSRFSFDMGGVESSVQEKLLEERHKEHKAKEAQRKIEDGYFDDFDEDFDQDMMDDYDDLEEKIPGVNADYDDDDDFTSPVVARNINGELKSWTVPGLSPVVASPITPAQAEVPAAAINSDYIAPLGHGQSPLAPKESLDPEESSSDESIEQTPPSVQTIAPETQQPSIVQNNETKPALEDDDDLYFDDGEFGDLNIDDQDGGFDESIFDDETSHLYDRKTVDKSNVQQTTQSNGPGYGEDLEEDSFQENSTHGLKHMPSVASEYGTGTIKRGPLGDPIPNMGPARAHGGVLTEQNLDILHNALAFAAHEAAGQSRFERTFSTGNRSMAQESISQASQTDESQPGLVSDDSRLSHLAEMGIYDGIQDDYSFDEDGYFDDPIIAAANAEALENDDEGFYGQEFGFYAQAYGSGTAELTNGGYFGPRGVEGISRSFSSRGKFQEPSLTPITERSEWSTRNSIISVKTPHGAAHSNPALASPGLAQLVDMGNLDDEMSLSALMKLRRGAWGGSNGSLRSSAGSPQPHTLPSSNRGSFTGPSEPTEDVSCPREEINSYGASTVKDNGLGQPADLPFRGPTYAGLDEELPNAGATQQLNVL